MYCYIYGQAQDISMDESTSAWRSRYKEKEKYVCKGVKYPK